MQRHALTTRAQSDWLIVRRDLDDVARAHNVAWDWQNPQAAPRGDVGVNGRLSGTIPGGVATARRAHGLSSRTRRFAHTHTGVRPNDHLPHLRS